MAHTEKSKGNKPRVQIPSKKEDHQLEGCPVWILPEFPDLDQLPGDLARKLALQSSL
jgi:hypothetical protein